jgi:hypothetical protein
MGLDCKLFPNPWGPRFREIHGNRMLATTRLPLDRHYDLFSQLPGYTREGGDGGAAPAVDFDVDVYEDEGIRSTRKDAYGTPLRCVTAGELAAVNTEDTSAWNKAAFAFIRALPPETLVVVYWC